MKLIMPMAGLATRFNQKSDELIIKPLIKVKGKYLYQLAMHPLKDLVKESDQIFLIQKSHNELKKVLQINHPQATITCLNGPTRGPGETLSFAANLLDTTPVIVCDCDLYFESKQFKEFIQAGGPDTDTALLTFYSDKPQYSYVEIIDGYVRSIAEKKVISQSAVCGCYYFSSGNKLKELLELTYKRITDREIFLSDVIQTSLMNKERCKAFACDIHVSLGTPEELQTNNSLISF